MTTTTYSVSHEDVMLTAQRLSLAELFSREDIARIEAAASRDNFQTPADLVRKFTLDAVDQIEGART